MSSLFDAIVTRSELKKDAEKIIGQMLALMEKGRGQV